MCWIKFWGQPSLLPLPPPPCPWWEFGSLIPSALARDVFRFAIWQFFSFLGFNVGKIHSHIHSFTLEISLGIYGVLAPLWWNSWKELGEGLRLGRKWLPRKWLLVLIPWWKVQDDILPGRGWTLQDISPPGDIQSLSRFLSICPSIRQIFTEHWLCPAFGNPAVNKTRHPDFAELTFHTGWKRSQYFVNSYYVLGISPTRFLCSSSPKFGPIAPLFQIPTCEVWRGEVKCPRSPTQGWWHGNSDSTCWIIFPHPHLSIEGPSKRLVLLCGDLIPYLGLPDDRTCVFSILAPHGSHSLPNG